VEKLTHLGEKTLKTNPGPAGWVLDIGLATQFAKNQFCYEISVKYSWLDKAQRIKWLGNIQRVDKAQPIRKLLDWKAMGTRPVGRPGQ